MRDAAADDFRQVPGVAVVTPPDGPDRFAEQAAGADLTLVIAPETDGVLGRLVRLVPDGRRLGPSPESVDLTADKLALAGHWRAAGVPTPVTLPLWDWPLDRTPAVFKPRDGAGSAVTFLAEDPDDAAIYRAYAEEESSRPLVAQDYVPGRPASVAFLVGPTGAFPLLPAWQLVTVDEQFRYDGVELPIPPALAARAVALGRRAVGCVPGLLGYVGVDLVLGDAADGSADAAIEINPRLTTSYVGLRELADFNLAGAMLRVARGEDPEPMTWKPGTVRFRPDGTVLRGAGL